MVLDAVSNFVRGSTDAAVGTDDTTVSVDDASIFPDPETDGEFNVVIWDVNNFPRPDQDGDVEILRVTERDTTDDELTVTRGQEMTSAAAHPEGSAIHLSPTAKMFTDIEDTFTTEAEAADAAPVQSVFGRVGDVVAETGDYAATQISNFGSEVLSSIDGSSISPSDITDLWDGSVVTADVDNESVSTDQLNTPPTGSFVQLGSNQTVADNTFTDVAFDTENERGSVSNLLSDNAVVIPSGFSRARVTSTIRWDSNIDYDLFTFRLNGSSIDAGFGKDTFQRTQSIETQTSHWFDVSENDEITIRVRQIEGESVDLRADDTAMEVWLI